MSNQNNSGSGGTQKTRRARILKKASFGKRLLYRSSWTLTDLFDSFMFQNILLVIVIILMTILIYTGR